MTESDEDEIRGKVVGFLNSREIIMNVGKDDGVKIGMEFAVLVPGGVPISAEVDEEGKPVTSETLEYAKSVVKVVRLSGDHLSIGRTFKTIKGRPAMEVPNPGYLGRMTGVFGIGAKDALEPTTRYPAIPDRPETFEIDAKDTVLVGIDMKVRKGDEVRLTTGDEFVFPGRD